MKKELNKTKGVFVKNLSTIIVKSIPEIESYMDAGTLNRKTGETAMNKDSSRSHSIFTIYIEPAENDATGKNHIKAGKLNLVDLAGSER
jgi:kinesin family protein 3/17